MVFPSKQACEVIRSTSLAIVAARMTAISALLSVRGGSNRMFWAQSEREKLEEEEGRERSYRTGGVCTFDLES